VCIRQDTLLLARQIALMILAIERIEFGALRSDLRSFARGDLGSVVPPFRVLAFWLETSSVITVLDSVHCSLGNERYYPQIDTMFARQ
jgi:hypothetical protein